MKSVIRSFTTRPLCGLLAAAALAVGAPTAAFADHRDDRGGRSERYYDHGRHRDRDRHPGAFRRGYRPSYALYRHGPSCSHRPAYRYGYWPVHPYGVFIRQGVYFGR